MKSFGSTLKVITFGFVILFALNMLIISVFFNVNVLSPIKNIIPDDNGILYKNQQQDIPDIQKMTAKETVSDDKTGTNTDSISDKGIGVNPVDDAINMQGNQQKEMHNEGQKVENPAGYYMTTAEIDSLDKLSLMDKLEAMALVSKINSKDADKIYDMALDGITFAEKKEIESILGKYLTSQDIQKLIEILGKN